MKRLRFQLAAAVAVFLFSPAPCPAQPVSHHSFIVNNHGSAAECMSCHNGTVIKHVSTCTVRCTYRDPHIIETPYPPADDFESYRSPEEVLVAGVRLPGGIVTCISCHNLRNPARYHLAVDNRGSRLCLVCHII